MSCREQKRAEIEPMRPSVGPRPLIYMSDSIRIPPPDTTEGTAAPTADRDSSALVAFLMRKDRLRLR